MENEQREQAPTPENVVPGVRRRAVPIAMARGPIDYIPGNQ